MPHNLKFRVLSPRLAVCRLGANTPVPAWVPVGSFFCVVRTSDELSLVCDENRVPEGVRVEAGWVALRVEGRFPFSMTGVLAGFLRPLAEGNIPILAISTFDTDYVLIKHEDVERAVKALAAAGHHECRD